MPARTARRCREPAPARRDLRAGGRAAGRGPGHAGDVHLRLRPHPRAGAEPGRGRGRRRPRPPSRRSRGGTASRSSTATPSAPPPEAPTTRRRWSAPTAWSAGGTARCICSATWTVACSCPTPQPPAAFDFDGARVGMLICYDVEFPEAVRRLAADGARTVLVPTANMAGFDVVQQVLVRARACENGCGVVYANYCGADDLFEYNGLSVICGPDGEVLAQAGAQGEQLHRRRPLPASRPEPTSPTAGPTCTARRPRPGGCPGRGRGGCLGRPGRVRGGAETGACSRRLGVASACIVCATTAAAAASSSVAHRPALAAATTTARPWAGPAPTWRWTPPTSSSCATTSP